MKRWVAILAGAVIFETALFAFVLAAFNQRLDTLQRTVRTASVPAPARNYDRGMQLSVRL
jgi:hypothetical protein